MRLRLLLLTLIAALLVPAAAQAADSHAPHGARLDWLPSDEWVMSGWLPYDKARLYELVHTDRAEVDAWLDDHRTLGQLARKRGWSSQRRLAHAWWRRAWRACGPPCGRCSSAVPWRR